MTRDLINGLLEMGGALITLLSVRQILRDRVMRGFHWGPTIFFTGWGIWNLYFYSSLSLPLSLLGSLLLVLVNCCYLFLMLRFSGERCQRQVRHHPNCRCTCAETPDGLLLEQPPRIDYEINWGTKSFDIVGGARPEQYLTPERLEAIRIAGSRMSAR